MEWIIIGVIAFLTGITASMGLGGGFILVIYLTVFAQMPQLAAQGINLVFFLPIAVVSLFFHAKNKMIEKSVILPSVLFGVVGVFVGVWAATALGSEGLSKLFAGFVLLVGIRELIMAFKTPKKDDELGDEATAEPEIEIKEFSE